MVRRIARLVWVFLPVLLYAAFIFFILRLSLTDGAPPVSMRLLLVEILAFGVIAVFSSWSLYRRHLLRQHR